MLVSKKAGFITPSAKQTRIVFGKLLLLFLIILLINYCYVLPTRDQSNSDCNDLPMGHQNNEDGGSPRKDVFQRVKGAMTIETFKRAQDNMAKAYDRKDFVMLGKLQRSFANTYRAYLQLRKIDNSTLDRYELSQIRDIEQFIILSERTLYPWIQGHQPYYTSLTQMHDSFTGRGYVICISSSSFTLGYSLIRAIRLLGSKLPVEVFYLGNDDLNEEDRNKLNAMEGVKCIDIQTIFNPELTVTSTSGWAIKPFALMASSFREAILIDSDVVFLKNPEELYDSAGYKAKGTVFYKDRTVQPGDSPLRQFVMQYLPKPLSPQVMDMRVIKNETLHEMESGVVLIDKGRRFLGLLATCKLNQRYEREQVTYRHMHGDKETFWIGFAMVNEPFHYSPYRIGNLGEASPSDQPGADVKVCSQQILHVDENGKDLFWFNSALLTCKICGKAEERDMRDIIHPVDYTFESDSNPIWEPLICLHQPADRMRKISNKDLATIRRLSEDWLSIIDTS